MSLLPNGTRVMRTGYPPDPHHGKRGTIVNHRSDPKAFANRLRYNLVQFDGEHAIYEWVEGHRGIVPLSAVELLAEVFDPPPPCPFRFDEEVSADHAK